MHVHRPSTLEILIYIFFLVSCAYEYLLVDSCLVAKQYFHLVNLTDKTSFLVLVFLIQSNNSIKSRSRVKKSAPHSKMVEDERRQRPLTILSFNDSH